MAERQEQLEEQLTKEEVSQLARKVEDWSQQAFSKNRAMGQIGDLIVYIGKKEHAILLGHDEVEISVENHRANLGIYRFNDDESIMLYNFARAAYNRKIKQEEREAIISGLKEARELLKH